MKYHQATGTSPIATASANHQRRAPPAFGFAERPPRARLLRRQTTQRIPDPHGSDSLKSQKQRMGWPGVEQAGNGPRPELSVRHALLIEQNDESVKLIAKLPIGSIKIQNRHEINPHTPQIAYFPLISQASVDSSVYLSVAVYQLHDPPQRTGINHSEWVWCTHSWGTRRPLLRRNPWAVHLPTPPRTKGTKRTPRTICTPVRRDAQPPSTDGVTSLGPSRGIHAAEDNAVMGSSVQNGRASHAGCHPGDA